MKSEQWEVYGRRVEAHLARVEAEIGELRDTLRGAGIMVHRQRTRIKPDNQKAKDTLFLLQQMYPRTATPARVGAHITVSPEYAYDLLQALVAKNTVEKVSRGNYRAVGPGQAVRQAVEQPDHGGGR